MSAKPRLQNCRGCLAITMDNSNSAVSICGKGHSGILWNVWHPYGLRNSEKPLLKTLPKINPLYCRYHITVCVCKIETLIFLTFTSTFNLKAMIHLNLSQISKRNKLQFFIRYRQCFSSISWYLFHPWNIFLYKLLHRSSRRQVRPVDPSLDNSRVIFVGQRFCC